MRGTTNTKPQRPDPLPSLPPGWNITGRVQTWLSIPGTSRLFLKLTVAAAIALIVLSLSYALLGPMSEWASPVAHLHGVDEANARNTTRQILIAFAGGM